MNVYVNRGNEQFGPYSEQEIQLLVVQGSLFPIDLVSREGRNEWTPLKDFLNAQADDVISRRRPPRVRVSWQRVSIIGSVLLFTFYAGLLIRFCFKEYSARTHPESTGRLFDAYAATNILDKSTAKPFGGPTNGSLHLNNGVIIPTGIKVASQPRDGTESKTALDTVNAIIKSDPYNIYAYLNRAAIYSQEKLWLQADSDYRSALQLDNNNFIAKFASVPPSTTG